MYGDKLRRLRKLEGWTVEEVAERIGVSKQTYSHYENENRRPSLPMILELAAVYQVDIDAIFSDETENPFPKNEKELSETTELLSGIKRIAEKQESRYPMFVISTGPYTFDEYCRGRSISACAVRSSTGWIFEGKARLQGDEFTSWAIEKESGEAITPTGGKWDCWLGYWHPLKFDEVGEEQSH